MKRLILVLSACALVAAAVSAQAPPQTSEQPKAATPPAQQPAAQVPPHPTKGQVSPGTNRPSRNELRVERLAAKLSLTAEQQTKAKAIFKEEDDQIQATRTDATLDAKQKNAKYQEIYAASREKFKKTLTPEQVAKFEARSGAITAKPATAPKPASEPAPKPASEPAAKPAS